MKIPDIRVKSNRNQLLWSSKKIIDISYYKVILQGLPVLTTRAS